MFHYLYYKLYQASLKSSLRDIPEFMTAVSFGTLLSLNFITLCMLFAKLDIIPFLFANQTQGGIFAFINIILTMLYYRKKKSQSIIDSYSQEDRTERIKGSVMVAIYVAISVLLMFIVPLFRPGEL
ncbi:hypothetical protein EIB71_00075 [Kaistella daneshvariae]|uniref:GtrA-like protein domain-containing protein n=1 Tax=Kaistella daneshvariae TaxID=2487074 RepID=A0ABM7C5C4_9FLAO|nr:hypothetical protein [Kaistella daneshvariae]AZI66170.1 hypothetical protein EIB71_00075 [Kaistella daneshvariae]